MSELPEICKNCKDDLGYKPHCMIACESWYLDELRKLKGARV